ncbi:MAG: 3,4-dihydroxy-2-butanone-4-phosphate synthase [Alphaproteobacteria bacterium]|nr:MAG: 3,4-dihydroxy-2-butanone-4-phosphate synthase [Alphaproteobacteria bacterium]
MSETGLARIEEIIEDARNGRMFILVDDEDRENEGDLVIPAQMATPEVINFMAKYGRGLICLSLTRERIERLGLPMMTQENASRHQTAFTVSIEAKEGVTTGISAHDRARTIQVAIDPTRGPGDIAVPGHVFPLMARDGGVLVRAGHTEASVDISRLAGLNPSAVICEVMRDDGTMARLPDLLAFAREHGLKVATIRDLIAYRLKHDSLVRCILEDAFASRWGGDWTMRVYENTAEFAEHVALVKGEVATDEPVPVRMHAVNIFEDILGEANGRSGQLAAAMEMIGEIGRGVVVLIRDVRPDRLSQLMEQRLRRSSPASPAQGPGPKDRPATALPLRDYGIGAQILLDLGVRKLILLSNTRHNIVGLQGYGLDIVEQRPIPDRRSGIAGGRRRRAAGDRS